MLSKKRSSLLILVHTRARSRVHIHKKWQAGVSIPFYVYYESDFNKSFITCFIFNFDIEIKAINIQRQKEMYFLIRYIYNNIFYYKSDRIVKILVKLSTVFYFLSIKFCTVIHYPCSKLLSYISYGNSCLYTIYIGNKA